VCRRWSLVRGISEQRKIVTRKEFPLFAAIVVMNHEADEDDDLRVLFAESVAVLFLVLSGTWGFFVFLLFWVDLDCF
jgi:hypothetical protein